MPLSRYQAQLAVCYFIWRDKPPHLLIHRTPPPPPPAPCSTPISRASPSAWATPLGTPSPSQTRPASSAPYRADGNGNGAASPAAAGGPGAGGPRSSKGARQALSYVSDDSAMEAPVLARSSNGSDAWQGAPLPAALLVRLCSLCLHASKHRFCPDLSGNTLSGRQSTCSRQWGIIWSWPSEEFVMVRQMATAGPLANHSGELTCVES